MTPPAFLAAARPRLAGPPLARALRGLLEAADLAHALRRTLAEAAALARCRRQRRLLDAARLAAADLGGEVDAAGQALGQAMALAETDAMGGRRGPRPKLVRQLEEAP